MNLQRNITFRAAILEALFEEMNRDENVLMMGEDVGRAGGVFKQTAGLFEAFGAARVIDTPISESGAFGIAVGAAATGSRPVFEVMFGDFVTLVMDQLVNQAAKLHYMSAGGLRVPLVLRTMVGVGGALGPQHSQSYHAWLAHVPGLKVVVPSDPAGAKALMKAAIRDDNPVVFLEDRRLHGVRSLVPPEVGPARLGEATVVREGLHVTIVAIGRMVQTAMEAAQQLAEEGVEVEIVDPRTLAPLDTATIVDSVRKTSRAIVVDAGHKAYGVTGEIASLIAEEAFDWLDAPVMRLGGRNAPIPFTPALEPLATPDSYAINDAVRAILR